MRCPNCHTEAVDGGSFCEECGASLKGAAATNGAGAGNGAGAVKARCTGCGAGPEAVDEDGFCTECGALRVRSGRHHLEDALSAHAAGVSDIGNSYHENQDYFVLGRGEGGALVAVVCDGVSQSQNAAEGAKIACEAALAAIRGGGADTDARAALARAMNHAQDAICKVPFVRGVVDGDEPVPPPQATMVGALVRDRRVTIGWIGDSRAYWIGRSGARQLTTDHSWFNDVVASGEMTAEQARADKRARAIVRSLGASLDGTNPGIEPETLTLNVIEPGILLIASDGFYVYADETQITQLVHSLPHGIDALTLARRLVDHARAAGGRDNITSVLFRFE